MQGFEIKTITNGGLWNAFVEQNTLETFHQCADWGEVYEKHHHKTWLLGILQNNMLVGACLTIKIQARRGTFLLVPHGPVFATSITCADKKSVMKLLKNSLSSLAQQEGAIFIRIAPILERAQENTALFHDAGFQDAPIFVQSEQSWVLDLTPDTQTLLQNMRKSTRYILKNKEGYGVLCRRDISNAAIDVFCSLYKQTVSNQGFFGQSTDFIKTEFEIFSKSNACSLYFAYYKNSPLAAAFIIEKAGAGFYHYGASIRPKEYIPAPHMLQWHIINNLKERGFTTYNFWGVAPNDKPNHP